MRPLLLAAALLSGALAAGCGAGEPGSLGGSTGAEPPPATLPAPDPDELLEGNGMVLDAGEGPALCLGAVADSLPPQCAGIPIAGWDWAAVDDEQTSNGATWGDYHVVGTYDGEVFTVSDIGPRVLEDSEEPYRAENPCPEPAGGWEVIDPAQSTQEDIAPAYAYATEQPDYVTAFIEHLVEPTVENEGAGPVVFVAAFTGDVERHEAEIRKRWTGPLCVVARDVPTEQELERIRAEVENRLPELGLEFLGSGTGGFEPTVLIEVVADPDGRAQALVDEEYGAGVVRFAPALTPVEG
jgi:hypothetical protein